ncbi:hypothetical protein GCM10025864_35160 [Luteimicrobium album]|uniref:ATP-dependent endonuclease n=1 Tax=Luteimicrobium album TaxID=1054550 RepID=A0ABQ6I6C3_9MICO|nr:hypothetical protein [Luteimicrobium album]GMA25757.1 hypothetical protein GCM10025864_35160 [Luteimicrobium album]
MPARETVTAVLVKGASDQLAVETLAARLGHDLAAEGTVVAPIGGAHALARTARRLGPLGDGLRLLGLVDVGEEAVCRRGLAQAGVGEAADRDGLARLGFFVCERDLEDELLHAVGAGAHRKHRYGRLLAEAVDLDHVPVPLAGLLDRL